MKKLFALIGLLGLIVGMGGALNAQEASGDTQSKLDTIFLYSYFQNPGEAQTFKFKFSATSGEKFIIKWKGSYHSSATDIDTISVETEKEIEVAYTFTSDYTHSHPTFNVSLTALTPDGHFKSLRIDSTYKYSGLTFKNCILLDTIQVAHNTLNDYNLSIWNCPLLRFLDISHNKLRGWYQEMTSALTYLDCSHNDIKDIVEKGYISLKTLDCSYNRGLRTLRLSDCEALTDLIVRCNDSLELLQVSNLPLQHLTCTENQNLSEINVDNCRLQTLDVSGNPALKRLSCANNQLTTLTFNDCPALISINCDYNQLSYIDLSPCENLQEFYCRNNRFSTLEIPDDMVLHLLVCDSNHIPLSTLVDLYQYVINGLSSSPQFLTAPILQVGEFLDLRNETHLNDCEFCEHYTIFLDGQQVEHRNSDGAEDHAYGLFAFPQAGNYRLQLYSSGAIWSSSVYYDLTVVDSVVQPQFSIPSGAVLPDTELILSTPTPDPRIYYTTDGSEPNETALPYTDPISITEAMTVKAVAIRDTFKSHIAIATYTMDTVARPTFSIPSGTVKIGTIVSLSTTTPDARIYYTTDGSEPNETALPYTDPISITEAMTVKAVAVYKTVKSQVTAASYTMDTVARPTFSIPSGTVKIGTIVSLSTTTPDARIIYTTDGSEPDNNALEYTEPIRINAAMTIKAIAVYKTIQSQIATAIYTIDSVYNEHDLKASKLRVYAKDRTIYLSEVVGEVEVFTVDGHCIYRGFDTAIPVGKRGLYIVSAAGWRWKVSVW